VRLQLVLPESAHGASPNLRERRQLQSYCTLLISEGFDSYEIDYIADFGCRRYVINPLNTWSLWSFDTGRFRCLGRRGSGVQIAPPRPNLLCFHLL